MFFFIGPAVIILYSSSKSISELTEAEDTQDG